MPGNSLASPLWALMPDAAQPVLTEIASSLAPGREAQGEGAALFGSPEASKDEERGFVVVGGVAVINISGPIMRSGMWSWAGRRISQGQDGIARALEFALADRSVRAILLDINSPGGVVSGTKELADRIAEAAATKPMAAYANGLMASAAMWLGAATGRVFAPVTATVGSIGVIMVHTDFSRLNEKWGISYSYITGGKLKAAGNPDNPLSDEARALFQKQVNELHAIFKADVMRGLDITAPAESWAEGQTMLAGEAHSLGLVTTIVRDIDSAINTLRQEAVMDYQTLAAQHPELLAEITQKAEAQAEQKFAAREQGKAEADTDVIAAKADADAEARVLAMVKAVAGDEVHAAVSRMVEAKLTPAQLEAMGDMFARPGASQPGQSPEQAAMGKILAGIESSQKPIPGSAFEKSDEAESRAAIERMGKLEA